MLVKDDPGPIRATQRGRAGDPHDRPERQEHVLHPHVSELASHREVELLVEFEERARFAVNAGLLIEDAAEGSDMLRGRDRGQSARDMRLEKISELEDLAELIWRDRPHSEATLRELLDDALAGKLDEGFSDRRARDRQRLRDLLFGVEGSRNDQAITDCAPDRRIRLPGERFRPRDRIHEVNAGECHLTIMACSMPVHKPHRQVSLRPVAISDRGVS